MKKTFAVSIVFLTFMCPLVHAMSFHFAETQESLIVAHPHHNRFGANTIVLDLLKQGMFKTALATLTENPELGSNPANVDENYDTALLLAIAKIGDFSSKDFTAFEEEKKELQEMITLILTNNPQPDLRFSGAHHGQTPLQRAVAQNVPPIVRQLLDAGAPAHIIDLYHRTPLHVGAQDAGLEIVEMLVDALEKANLLIVVLKQRDAYGRTIVTYIKLNKHCRHKLLEYFVRLFTRLNEPKLEDLQCEAQEEISIT